LRAAIRWYKTWAERQEHAREGYLYEFNREMLVEHRAAVKDLGIDWAVDSIARPV
jgi:hypothetical protein